MSRIPDGALQELLDIGDQLTESMRQNPEGTHTTDSEWAWLLTLSASTVHLIRDLREARAEVESARAVLARLVALKDGPRDDAYRAAKERAWTDARVVLADPPVAIAEPTHAQQMEAFGEFG